MLYNYILFQPVSRNNQISRFLRSLSLENRREWGGEKNRKMTFNFPDNPHFLEILFLIPCAKNNVRKDVEMFSKSFENVLSNVWDTLFNSSFQFDYWSSIKKVTSAWFICYVLFFVCFVLLFFLCLCATAISWHVLYSDVYCFWYKPENHIVSTLWLSHLLIKY